MTDQLLAAVDVGTNSVHMVVARVSATGRIEILAREKEMVRLGHSGGDMKLLTDDAMTRGIAALRRCRDVAEAYGAEMAVVATSAVREAENRNQFIKLARADAGVNVEVISGLEEARLIHLGVLQALPVYDSRILLCDIGGGSTELLLGKGAKIKASRSLKLGAIRLTQRFQLDEPFTSRQVDAARRFVRNLLAGFSAEVGTDAFEMFVASSGTAEAVVTVALDMRGETEMRTHNAATVSAAEVSRAVELLVGSTIAERTTLDGVGERRSDIIVAGALILDEVMTTFGATSMMYSDYSLREGVLLDQSQRRGGAGLKHLHDLRRQSVTHLAEIMDEDPDHSRQCARLALELFDILRDRLGIDKSAGDLLEAAALLCNVGVFVAHSGHHRHSYYVIRNSEHLSGYTDREIEIIALLARYHRKSGPKDKHVEWASLTDSDRDLVSALASILRVAIGLDRGRRNRVGGVKVDFAPDQAFLTVWPAGVEVSVEMMDLEIHAASLRSDLLSEVLGVAVVVQSGPKPKGAPGKGLA